MMNLENDGYLHQPHTSAGRLPTDRGYRAYVDALALDQGDLEEHHRRELSEAITGARSAPKALEAVAGYIRDKTRLVTFHMPYRQSGLRLKHMHMERLDKERLLVVWVSRGGHIFQSILNIRDDELNRVLVEKAENYFNKAFVDSNLIQIRRILVDRAGVPASGICWWARSPTSPTPCWPMPPPVRASVTTDSPTCSRCRSSKWCRGCGPCST